MKNELFFWGGRLRAVRWTPEITDKSPSRFAGLPAFLEKTLKESLTPPTTQAEQGEHKALAKKEKRNTRPATLAAQSDTKKDQTKLDRPDITYLTNSKTPDRRHDDELSPQEFARFLREPGVIEFLIFVLAFILFLFGGLFGGAFMLIALFVFKVRRIF